MKDNRQYAIDYLLGCGFVEHYVKKLMLPSDIDELYEDFIQETWLAILETKTEKWDEIFDNSLIRGKGYEYEIRNWVSVLIRNTVRSTSSNAYKVLKKKSVTELHKTNEEWHIMEYGIAEDEGELNRYQPKNRRDNE